MPHLRLKVARDKAKLLLDVCDDVTLRGRGEGIAPLGHDLHGKVREAAASEGHRLRSVGQRVTFVDGHHVRGVVTHRDHEASGAAGGIELEDRALLHEDGGHLEGLKHELDHLLGVALRVVRWHREEHRVLLWRDPQLGVEGAVPERLHVVPVCHYPVLNGILQRQDPTLALGFIADIRILLVHTHHDAAVLAAADESREDGTRSIVPRETSLDVEGPLFYHDGRGVVVVVIVNGSALEEAL
mmetsp:Transcript_109269/g.308882  ORF Transcript_109269/g.308882 Transcript_109269/m.308882 type:complete len:242 (+) Transcript_109269:2073-2798(+)